MKWQVSINSQFYKYIKILKTSLNSGCPDYFPMAFYPRYFAFQKDLKHGWHPKETVGLSWLWPFFPVKTFSDIGHNPSHFSFLHFWDYSVTIYHHCQLVKKILTDTGLVPSIFRWSHSCLWCTGGIISWVWGKTRLEEFPAICMCPKEIITEIIAKINFFMGNRTSSMWDIKTAFTSFCNFDLEVLS